MPDPGGVKGSSLEALGLPPELRASLEELRDGIANAAGTNLAGLIYMAGSPAGAIIMAKAT